MQRQIQMLCYLESKACVDFLSVGDWPWVSRIWLKNSNLKSNNIFKLSSVFLVLVYKFNYIFNVLLVNKLGLFKHWKYFLRFDVKFFKPFSYDYIFCYYPWNYSYLCLKKYDDRVIVDTGDVMSERHERIGRRIWINLSRLDEKDIVFELRLQFSFLGNGLQCKN